MIAHRRVSRLLLALLVLVSLAPAGLLALRALSAAWRYPSLLPARAESDTIGLASGAPEIQAAFVLSITLAIVTGCIGTAFGFVAARTLIRAPARVRHFAAGAAFLPVIAPPIALGVGIQVLTIRMGLGGSVGGVVLAHLVPAAGYLTLFFLGVLSAYDVSMEEQARSLGATRWQTFLRVTAPALRARWLEAMVLGALVSWGQLALTLLIGGGAVRTLPIALLSFVRAGDDRLAAAAAIMLTVPPALAFGLMQRGARQTGAGV